LARACYHLGNRHTAIQITDRQVCYLQDQVLDAMVAGLGLEVRHAHGPFEPESGAYSGGGHHHG
jgi:urease accessory protein